MHNTMNNSYLEVNLGQIRRNTRTSLDRLPAGTALIPVLKDDAYGLGIEPVGRLLADLPEITLLAVSHVSEGLALRQACVEKDILILGGVPSFLLPPAVEHGLTVTVGRPGMVPILAQRAAALGCTARIQI